MVAILPSEHQNLKFTFSLIKNITFIAHSLKKNPTDYLSGADSYPLWILSIPINVGINTENLQNEYSINTYMYSFDFFQCKIV